MESEILKLAMSNGIWAVLFVVLFWYVLKQQEKRDNKAEEREDKLLTALELAQKNNQKLAVSVQNLADDVDIIKDTLSLQRKEG